MLPTYRELITVTKHALLISKRVRSTKRLSEILYGQAGGFSDLATVSWNDAENATTTEREHENCRIAEHLDNIAWLYETFAWSAESFACAADEHAYPFNFQMVKDCITQNR